MTEPKLKPAFTSKTYRRTVVKSQFYGIASDTVLTLSCGHERRVESYSRQSAAKTQPCWDCYKGYCVGQHTRLVDAENGHGTYCADCRWNDWVLDDTQG